MIQFPRKCGLIGFFECGVYELSHISGPSEFARARGTYFSTNLKYCMRTARPASGTGVGETDAELWCGELNEPDSLQF